MVSKQFPAGTNPAGFIKTATTISGKMSRLRIVLFIFTGIIVSVVVYSIYAYRGILNTWEETYRELKDYERDKSVPQPREEVISILLLVIDQEGLRGEGDMDKPGRSDAVLLCVLNIKTGTVTALSIPRDLRVRIAPGRYDKLNHAYAYGPEVSIVVIEDLLKFPVDYYIAFNYKAFGDIIDIMGGVRIEPDQSITSATNRIDEGFQRMDGETAMFYVRFRSDHEGDFGRIRRQQQVVEAMIRQAVNPRTFINIGGFSRVAGENMRHNIPKEFIFSHWRDLISLRGGEFEKIALEGFGVTIDSLWYFIPNRLHLLEVRERLRSEIDD